MAKPRRKKWKPEPEKILEIDGVPTVAGLAKMGREFAYPTDRGHHITEAGHRLMQEALSRNARESIEGNHWHGTSGTWTGPAPQPGFESKSDVRRIER